MGSDELHLVMLSCHRKGGCEGAEIVSVEVRL